jgi:two-component system C4-dicarboxylate transport sensor histidine kinase DctB
VRPFGDRGRAYVFAHGVRSADGTLTGIVAVMFDLGTLEQVWSLSTNPVFVADANGTVLLSNRPAWRMQPLQSLVPGPFPAGQIDVARALPQLSWTLHVLADAAPIAEAQIQAALIVAVAALALAAALIALANRQLDIRLHQRRDRATALRLERLVRDRTSDLTRTNLALADEVTHHKQTAAALRQTQTELIQTGKLAALGQMSTALSHEYSQPLAAAKSYADNAIQLLDRGRTVEVRENLGLISGLADRMAAISRHLRNFARKPNVAFGSVPVATVIDDTLAVLSARINEVAATVTVSGERDAIWVRAGQVRLQQVLVNLVANALDASRHLPAPEVHVAVSASGAQVQIAVRDFGSGIEADVLDQIFDPFFTTKGPGEGLGLGLSISYNIVKDFGGRLTAASAGPGALFTVTLRRGDAAAKAAE